MAERGEIREQNTDPVSESEDVTSTARNFRVVARSALDAKFLLRDRENVFRGVVWESAYGETADETLICRGVEAGPAGRDAPLGGLADYEVKARYATKKRGGKQEAAIGGGPVYGLDVSLATVPVDVDGRGRALVSSSMEPFDPPLSDTEAREVIPVEWWVLGGSVLEVIKSMRGLAGSLNASAWLGAPRGSVFCLGVRKQDETAAAAGRVAVKFSAGFEYRRPLDLGELGVRVVKVNPTSTAIFGGSYFLDAVQADVEGFDELRADRGRRSVTGTLESGYGDWKPIVRNKREVTEPVDLNGEGGELKSGETKVAILLRMKRRYVEFGKYGV